MIYLCGMAAKLLPALALLFFTVNARCQTNDLRELAHNTVEHYKFGTLQQNDIDNLKKLFGDYDKSDVANALIADLDVNRGSPDSRLWRYAATLGPRARSSVG